MNESLAGEELDHLAASWQAENSRVFRIWWGHRHFTEQRIQGILRQQLLSDILYTLDDQNGATRTPGLMFFEKAHVDPATYYQKATS